MFLPELAVVCPTCNEISANMNKCPVTSCDSCAEYVRAPTVNYKFNIGVQIQSILECVPIIYRDKKDNKIRDVIDGLAHARIRAAEKNFFISLTLNSDGVLVQKISRSLWITTIAINEIPRDTRFKLPNMIIAMVSYGSQKPKRAEFSSLLSILVDELVELERGIDVSLFSTTNTRLSKYPTTTRVCVYLLGVVSDKPAQSLIQNMIDCGGFYGCGKCQVVGKKIKTAFNNAFFLHNYCSVHF